MRHADRSRPKYEGTSFKEQEGASLDMGHAYLGALPESKIQN